MRCSGFIFIGVLLVLLSISVSAEAVYHGLYTAPFDRFVNLRFENATNPIVYHGVSRSYYQKVLQVPSGIYYMYYSDINVSSGLTMTSVANSTNGNSFKFVRYAKFSGHPYVGYNADGFGINNNYMLWSWDEVSVGKQSPYRKSIKLWYGNNSDLIGMKDMGWVNFTWMMGTSNNGTISGTYGINKVFYNASGNGLGNTLKNPFGYKFAVYFDCAGGSAENFCVVGSDDPTKFFRTSLYKTLINDTPGAWDNLKLGYGDVVKFKGYNLQWYEGGVADTRIGTGLAYSLNGTKFTRLAGNPILKKSSSGYLNQSVGGASLLIEGNTARLYIAGRNFTGGSYQIIQYKYDVRQDKNITISGVTGASSQIMNRTNGVLYNYNSSSGGDKVLLLTGVKYNIRVKPDSRNMVFISGLNGTNAGDIDLRVQTAVSKPANTQALSSVIYSSATGFDVATLYFNKTLTPTKICSCQYWNTSLALCNAAWVCNATSAYQHGENSTQYWINVTHFSGYGLGNDTKYVAPVVINVSAIPLSVLQGQNITVNVNVNKGVNDLNQVWYNLNGTLGGWTYAVNGSNMFVIFTGGKLGDYGVSGYVNDSNNTIRTAAGPVVNIYTTTTTTTTTTSTTTTTLKGSFNLTVTAGGSATVNGVNIILIAPNSSVVSNQTINTTIPYASTPVLINAIGYVIKVSTSTGNQIIFNDVNFTEVDKTIKIHTANLTGIKPIPLRTYDGILASNASNLGRSTLVFNTVTRPNYICLCSNFNYGISECSVSWSCNNTDDYQSKYTGGKLYVNISHFSAYMVGSGESLRTWTSGDPAGGSHRVLPGRNMGFYANYSDLVGKSINGSKGFCQFMENSAGWSTKVNMTFNDTGKIYYVYKSFGSPLIANYNISCDGSAGGFNKLSVVDSFSIYAPLPYSMDWGQVYWWTAQSVAHSLHFGVYNTTVACDQTHLFYVDGITGSIKKINASTDKTGNHRCQNTTQGALVISNDGSVSININASFNQITSGVTMKVGHTNSGWQESCSGSCGIGGCDLSSTCLMINVTPVRISYNLPMNTSKEYWMWADFKNVIGTSEPTKGNLTTNATKSG